MTGEPVVEEIDIAASPAQVYDLVADVARMGEFSPEATGARRAKSALRAGDTFVGTNRRGMFSWVTQCSVRVADRGREFTFDVDFGPLPVSRWSYTFTETSAGVRVTETWWDRRKGARGFAIKAVGQVLIPGSRPEHNRRNMQATLRRLKTVAESAPPAS